MMIKLPPNKISQDRKLWYYSYWKKPNKKINKEQKLKELKQ